MSLQIEFRPSGCRQHLSDCLWPKRVTEPVIQELLDSDLFDIDDEDAVRDAIEEARRGKGDLADYILGALNRSRGCRYTVTLDRSLKDSDAFRLL